MPNPRIAVSYSHENKHSAATQLAAQLNLDVITDAQSENYDYLLIYTNDYLGLLTVKDKKSKPFYIDFLSPQLTYRRKQASLRKELLARSIGKHPRENPSIVDATAGLGRDSFILASLGFHITMLERSPILHALLCDALHRAKIHTDTTHIAERMTLIHTDALNWLSGKETDVIYLDPMFPEREKSASVNKNMVILQNLLGKDDNCEQLFTLALTCAHYRIVVKRPRLAKNIAGQKPNFSLLGKSSRFDVYLG